MNATFCTIILGLCTIVTGSNIETRIHRLITPKGVKGIEFGTSISSCTAIARLVIASPKHWKNSLYSCAYDFRGKKTTKHECNKFLNSGIRTGLGTSMTTLSLGNNNLIVACSNHYMFSCPNRTIEQRMVGKCQSINVGAGTTYQLLTPCPTGCPQGLIADIVFLMDASGSVKEANYYTGLGWIIQVLQRFSYDIDQGNVQSGYVIFNGEVYLSEIIRPRSFYDLKVSMERISDYPKGGTRTDKAINEGYELLRRSPRKVPKVMITITDGESNRPDLTKSAAHRSRSGGVIMIAVGVGSATTRELRLIATGDEYSGTRVMTVASYDNLVDILDKLSQVIKESASTSLEGSDGNSTTELTNCQFGSSISTIQNELFIGAPGSYDRMGTVAEFMLPGFPRTVSKGHLNDTDLAGVTQLTPKQLKDAYFGYSTSAGVLQRGNVWIVTGAPRYVSRGAALLYKRADRTDSFILHPSDYSEYWQLGGYFGHSVLVMDINGDGFDDLLVSEPLYSKTAGYDEGLVFIYMNDQSSRAISNWAVGGHTDLLMGSGINGARFGMSIVNAGDLDSNGYNDVIIGAPNEKLSYTDVASGAVYVYYSSQTGLDVHKFQRIHGKSLGSTTVLRSFGWSAQGGHDFDGNSYPDVSVTAPMSDSVVLLRSRKLIVTTLKLSVKPRVIDILSCAANKQRPCAIVTACMAAQYQKAPTSERFSMTHNITADSLIPNSMYRRFTFESTKTDTIKTADIAVGQSAICHDYNLQLNLNTLGKVNTGGLETTPVLTLAADLAPTHKATVMSGVLSTIDIKTADLSFNTGCTGCQHDLRIVADYSYPMSKVPLRLDGTNRMLTINCTIRNDGPENALFLKVNISSGNLTITRQVTSSCIAISEDESDRKRGETVLKYISNNPILQDTMMARTQCKFSVDIDFARLESFAKDHRIVVIGRVYSNAGIAVSGEVNESNNVFTYENLVQYESNLILQAVTEPIRVFFQPPKDTSVQSVETLQDNILGGGESNFFHRYTIYNKGPLGLGSARIVVNWTEKTNEGHDLIYLIDVYCEDEKSMSSKSCKCYKSGIANKYAIAPTKADRRTFYREHVLTYPTAGEKIATSEKLTCGNSQCGSIDCDIDYLNKFRQITVVLNFIPWAPVFAKQFVEATAESSMQLIPSNATALPISDTSSVTSILASYDPENPPLQPTPDSLDVGAIIGGIIGGLLLLAIAVAMMWKLGFFKSKYGKMTSEAKKSVKESSNTIGKEVPEGNSAPTGQPFGSTIDLVDG